MRGSDLLQVLGLKFMDDGLEDNVHDLNPKSDSLLARIRFEYLGGDSPHYSIDRMSATNSLPLYASADGFDRIFVKVQDNSYRVVSSTVTFGAIADGDSLSTKAYMMAEIVNYLLNISTITDLPGKILYERAVQAGYNAVDAQWLLEGFYLLTLKGQNHVYTTKLVVRK